MACTTRYATAQEFANHWCLTPDLADPAVLTEINTLLDIAAADVHAPLASVGACNCVSDAWAIEYLKKLNVIDAGVIYNCACGPHLTTDEKRLWLEWLNVQFENIRQSKIDLCGQTGSEYPAFGVAERNLTDMNAARIIYNRILRQGTP